MRVRFYARCRQSGKVNLTNMKTYSRTILATILIAGATVLSGLKATAGQTAPQQKMESDTAKMKKDKMKMKKMAKKKMTPMKKEKMVDKMQSDSSKM